MKKKYLILTLVLIACVVLLIVFVPNVFSNVEAPDKEVSEENQEAIMTEREQESTDKQVHYTINFGRRSL